MTFIARSFIFDGIPSESLGLYVSQNLTATGNTNVATSNNVKLYTEQLYRRPRVFLYGVEQTPPLSIPLSFTSLQGELSAIDAEIAAKKLFGQQSFKRLQIVQPDMESIYFNCFLTSPEIVRIGNMIVGFNAVAVCDSPFAWEYPRTLSLDYPDDVVSTQFVFNNTSDNSFYMYPYLSLTISNVGGSAQLINISDNNRTFLVTGLSGNEEIVFDCDLQIITSSTGLKRLSNFNKQWLRFVQNKNIINVFGNINNMSITYQNARKVGG